MPEVVANVGFGGAKRNVLYICGTTSLYAVRLMVNGAKTYSKRASTGAAGYTRRGCRRQRRIAIR